MPTTSAHRVSDNTDKSINQAIARRTEMNVAYLAGHPEQIERRLRELDREWDIERALETGSSALTLSGLILGIARNRKWLLLSLAVQGFFIQHAIQGWCPPLPVLRRLGFRTQAEIEQERYALKVMRGDFSETSAPRDVVQAVRE
jgi:hypothetical protein